MFDKELTLELLNLILTSSKTIQDRFKSIKSVSDFTDSPNGLVILDSICMQLIALGEGLKQVDKITNKSLLKKYPQIDWIGAKAMRDIISHQYFDIDAEIVYDVCVSKIPDLSITIEKIIEDLN
ncbi:MAG: antitoxin [Candidatus Cloacimonas sp. SDB]|nr:MAG: antitoxin [Candidatus Cloacimonas sp. SDB]